MKFCLVVFFTGLVLTMPAGAQTQNVRNPSDLEFSDRLQFVRTLLEHSSASRKVMESTNPEAKNKHEEARSHFRNAQDTHALGDDEGANIELIEATRVMFEAVRLSEINTVVDEKKRRDYQNRLASINALMKAQKRVSSEKGEEASGKELRVLIDEKITTANGLLEKDKLDEARAVLDEAYIAAKVNISMLRNGDTLVRTLNFETPEEEYHYEIDRNDTHQMLISILLRDKKADVGREKMINSFLDAAKVNRQEAEQLAKTGKFEDAVKALEESTKNISRALRTAGVYIPG